MDELLTNVARQSGTLSIPALITYLTDSDGDGVPDEWEATYGFGTNNIADGALDADDDGLSNWAEYVAGTDPTNGLSCLRIDPLAAPPGATLTFGVISNRTYTIQFSEGVDTPWSRLADVPARATNRLEVIADPAFTINRFYRLATPQQP